MTTRSAISSISSRRRTRAAQKWRSNSIGVNFSVFPGILKCATRDDEQGERDQEQDTASRGELLEDSPEEFFDDVNAAAVIGQTLRCFRSDIFRVEAVTGARFGLELRPELADLKAIGDALPKALHTRSERNGLSRSLSGRLRGCRHRCQLDYRRFVGEAVTTAALRDSKEIQNRFSCSSNACTGHFVAKLEASRRVARVILYFSRSRITSCERRLP